MKRIALLWLFLLAYCGGCRSDADDHSGLFSGPQAQALCSALVPGCAVSCDERLFTFAEYEVCRAATVSFTCEDLAQGPLPSVCTRIVGP